MAASARPGERATSFAVACSLLSRFVRQNGAAAAELGLGIKGERGRSRVWLLRLVAFGGRLQKIYFFLCGGGYAVCVSIPAGSFCFGGVWCEI